MPSSSRLTRSLARTDIAACSSAWAAPASSGPPRHTASHERPPESTSRLAHWCASITGWRWTKVAMQPTPRRTRDVALASAESRVTASRRGLAGRLSPTHTVSKAPDCSAEMLSSTRSRAGMAPSTTARLARVSPNDAFMVLSPQIVRGALVEERLDALLVVVRGAEPRVGLALQLEG